MQTKEKMMIFEMSLFVEVSQRMLTNEPFSADE